MSQRRPVTWCRRAALPARLSCREPPTSVSCGRLRSPPSPGWLGNLYLHTAPRESPGHAVPGPAGAVVFPLFRPVLSGPAHAIRDHPYQSSFVLCYPGSARRAEPLPSECHIRLIVPSVASGPLCRHISDPGHICIAHIHLLRGRCVITSAQLRSGPAPVVPPEFQSSRSRLCRGNTCAGRPPSGRLTWRW